MTKLRQENKNDLSWRAMLTTSLSGVKFTLGQMGYVHNEETPHHAEVHGLDGAQHHLFGCSNVRLCQTAKLTCFSYKVFEWRPG